MIEIIQRREVKMVETYHRFFERPGREGSGLSFDCDAAGTVDETKLQPAGLENYHKCLTGMVDGEPVIDRGVEIRMNKWTQEKIGRCKCGKEVYLSNFTNTCDCGRDYNMSGSELAPRSQWGEETGESVEDILAINGMSAEELLDGDDY